MVAVAHRYRLLSVNEDRTTASKTSQCKSHFLAASAERRLFKQCGHYALNRKALMVKFRRICGDSADIGFSCIARAGQKQHNKRCTFKRSKSVGEPLSREPDIKLQGNFGGLMPKDWRS